MKKLYVLAMILGGLPAYADIPSTIDIFPKDVATWELKLSPCTKKIQYRGCGAKVADEGFGRVLQLDINNSNGVRQEILLEYTFYASQTRTGEPYPAEKACQEDSSWSGSRESKYRKILTEIFENKDRQFYSEQTCSCYGKHFHVERYPRYLCYSVYWNGTEVGVYDGVFDTNKLIGKHYQECRDGAIFEP